MARQVQPLAVVLEDRLGRSDSQALRRASRNGGVEAAHEAGPVAGRRRIDRGAIGERAADRVQVVEPLPARRAAAQVRLDARAIDRIELAVEVQLDVGGSNSSQAVMRALPSSRARW